MLKKLGGKKSGTQTDSSIRPITTEEAFIEG